MKTVWLAAVVAVSALVCGAAHAQGLSSANYSIPVYVINSGGGAMSSANYTLVASIGEPVIGDGASANYKGSWGFLAGLLATIGMRGDVNRDGLINAADVAMLLEISGGLLSGAAPTVDFPNGDVNASPGDGKIDVLDASKVLRYIYLPGSPPL
jgi:hypothetical protein